MENLVPAPLSRLRYRFGECRFERSVEMNYANEGLRKSAVVMKAIGWVLIIGLPVGT